MKIVGIIAEYNPFHRGHEYQVKKAKEMTGADYVVVIMSGNFVQRGTPTLLHKYARTHMALAHGADLVIELPVSFATASAEYFAYGAVSILHQLEAIDYLCFGSECGDINVMSWIADLLLEEPVSYREALKSFQKQGLSYPEARTKALCSYLQESSIDPGYVEEVLSSPNNILGIEYIKAIKRWHSSIQAITIKREGASYHSHQIEEVFASATAIRKHIVSQNSMENSILDLPLTTKLLLEEEYGKCYPITEDDFSNLTYYQLKQQRYDLDNYFDVSKELAFRIQNKLSPGLLFSTFTMELKTKQYTQTRIQRALLHILLNISKQTIEQAMLEQNLYARILGFVTSSSEVIKRLKESSSIPMITKVADAKTQLSSSAYSIFQLDLDATHLYHQVVFTKYHTLLKDEYSTSPIRVTLE